MIGYVYLMTNGKEYKIGLTGSEPEKRMKQLQTGNSSKIELVGFVACKDMEKLESDLHSKFSAKRQMGEWFTLDDNDLYTIFERFKAESINEDMSLIPTIVKDVDSFMEIDGRRLAYGKKLLHKDKYIHIDNHKEILMDYMEKTEILIKRGFEILAEEKRKEEDEKDRLCALLEKDAKKIFMGEKPIHTFEYADLGNWKWKLQKIIDRKVMEEKRKVAEEKRKVELAEIKTEVMTLGFIEKWMYSIPETSGFYSPREYLEKDKKRVSLGLDPIYQGYYLTKE